MAANDRPTTTPPSTSKSTAPSPHSLTRQALALLSFIAIVGAVATLSSLTTAAAIDGWYAVAAKPMWTPPNGVFGPVWTVLYLAMAVAAWLVWRRPDSLARTRALRTYVVQLALNSLWSPTFFGLGAVMGSVGLWTALGIIVLLNFAILATIIRFEDVSRWASWMLIPYWFWTLFATTLNAAMAVLAH